MSSIHQNISPPIASSSSAFLGQSNLRNIRRTSVAVFGKGSGAVRCVASPSAEKTAYNTKVSRNENFAKLQAGYLFPEIRHRRFAHMLKYPDAKVTGLGIGDTTEPIPEVITSAMAKIWHQRAAHMLGYPDAKVIGLGIGDTTEPIPEVITSAMAKQLRATVASTYYAGLGIVEDDIFVSDGARSDISRLQVLFGSNVTMAVQDPSYTAHVDPSVILGQTGQYQKDIEKYANIEYMRCTPENGFVPDLSTVKPTDIIFFCSPNNPTGYAASMEQLTNLMEFAEENGSLIVYDSAYAMSLTARKHRARGSQTSIWSIYADPVIKGFNAIFFCSPNNPTGYAASREQLTNLVEFAEENGSIIVYDSAYAMSLTARKHRVRGSQASIWSIYADPVIKGFNARRVSVMYLDRGPSVDIAKAHIDAREKPPLTKQQQHQRLILASVDYELRLVANVGYPPLHPPCPPSVSVSLCGRVPFCVWFTCLAMGKIGLAAANIAGGGSGTGRVWNFLKRFHNLVNIIIDVYVCMHECV